MPQQAQRCAVLLWLLLQAASPRAQVAAFFATTGVSHTELPAAGNQPWSSRRLLQTYNATICQQFILNCVACRFQSVGGSTKAICSRCAPGHIVKSQGRACCELTPSWFLSLLASRFRMSPLTMGFTPQMDAVHMSVNGGLCPMAGCFSNQGPRIAEV